MDILHIRKRLEDLPEEIAKAEEMYVTEKATLEYRKDLTKHLLANFKTQHQGSNAEKETRALASDEYKRHLDLIHAHATTVGELGAEYHRLQNEFEAMRSLNKNID